MKRIAEALVECGMYEEYGQCQCQALGHIGEYYGLTKSKAEVLIVPFNDTLEACHQRTALVNWLVKNHYSLWNQSSGLTIDLNEPDMLAYTCNRIKWCFEQLEESDATNS